MRDGMAQSRLDGEQGAQCFFLNSVGPRVLSLEHIQAFAFAGWGAGKVTKTEQCNQYWV